MIDVSDLQAIKITYQKKVNGKDKTFETDAYECLDFSFLNWIVSQLENIENTNRLRFRKKIISVLDEMKNYKKPIIRR